MSRQPCKNYDVKQATFDCCYTWSKHAIKGGLMLLLEFWYVFPAGLTPLSCYINIHCNKSLVPWGSEFCFPQIAMFPETFSGNIIHSSHQDQSLNGNCYPHFLKVLEIHKSRLKIKMRSDLGKRSYQRQSKVHSFVTKVKAILKTMWQTWMCWQLDNKM